MTDKLKITHGTAAGQERDIITVDRAFLPPPASDSQFEITKSPSTDPVSFIKGLLFGLAIGAGVALTIAGVA